jgi:hypothetical protein
MYNRKAIINQVSLSESMSIEIIHILLALYIQQFSHQTQEKEGRSNAP